MNWILPPIIKIYEALGCIADNRILMENTTAKVFSSSKKKFYTVTYDSKLNAIMSNDNSSYYLSNLGYPSIAFLMKIGELEFSEPYSDTLKNIKWKDINTNFKNDFLKTQQHIDTLIESKGINLEEFHKYIAQVMEQIKNKKMKFLGEKIKPPEGY